MLMWKYIFAVFHRLQDFHVILHLTCESTVCFPTFIKISVYLKIQEKHDKLLIFFVVCPVKIKLPFSPYWGVL